MLENVVIVSGTSHPDLAKKVANILGKEYYLPKIYVYGTGCFELTLSCNMRGKNIFIIQSIVPENVNHLTLETSFLINAAYKASASEVNLIVPHLGWDQSDKKWTGRMPIAGELIAAFFHSAGMQRFVGLQLHSPQYTGFFPMPVRVDHLVADKMFLEYIKENKLYENAVLFPGDLGFGKKARENAAVLGIESGKVDKERISGDKVEIHAIYGNVAGKRAIIWDDKIGKGTTIRAIAEELQKMGSESLVVIATHALLTDKAIENLSHPLIKEIIVTDSLPQSKQVRQALPLTVLSIDKLLASAITEISTVGGSISKLFKA